MMIDRIMLVVMIIFITDYGEVDVIDVADACQAEIQQNMNRQKIQDYIGLHHNKDLIIW